MPKTATKPTLYTSATASTYLCRSEELDGRACLVFPVVMMCEGVHAGSGGAYFYSAEELGKIPQAWNHKPVVMGHPMDDQTPVSACSAKVINDTAVGVILNAFCDGDKLKAEAWIYEDKASKVAPNLLVALRSGTITEVSIGCFMEINGEAGEWNGEKYKGHAKHIVPDHLAILQHTVGACSVADGAGIPRIFEAFTVNADQSFETVSRALWEAGRGLGLGEYFYIEAVFPDRVIYGAGDEFSQYPYTTLDAGGVSVQNSVTKVRRVISYDPVVAEVPKTVVVHNEEDNLMALKDLLKDKVSEAGLAALDALSAEDVTALEAVIGTGVPGAEGGADAGATGAETGGGDPPFTTSEAGAVVVPTVTLTDNEVADLPEVRRMMAESREKAVAVIVANKRNLYTPEQLAAKPLSELNALAALASTTATDFTLNGAVTPSVAATKVAPLPSPK